MPSKKSFATRRRLARACAVQCLYASDFNPKPYLQLIADLQAILPPSEQINFQGADKSYLQTLLSSVQACQQNLDRVLEPHLNRSILSIGVIELVILRIAVLELSTRLQVPSKVAMDEAIALAKIFGATDSFKFINGVLHHLCQSIPCELDGPRS